MLTKKDKQKMKGYVIRYHHSQFAKRPAQRRPESIQRANSNGPKSNNATYKTPRGQRGYTSKVDQYL